MTFHAALNYQAEQEHLKQEQICSRPVPRHIAIIMDGNRRWAQKNGLPPSVGHWKGADTLRMLTEKASQVGVEALTVYSFSTENWNRSEEEIDALMDLFMKYLEGERASMVQQGVRLGHIGDISKLPQSLQTLLAEVEKETADGQKITLVLALNYGGRDEITRAVQKVAKEVAAGALLPEEITESTIEQFLDTAPYGCPDLLIRTSGEMRISNFLLWQISYAELYVTKKLWPEFSTESFFHAIEAFQNRDRRLGG